MKGLELPVVAQLGVVALSDGVSGDFGYCVDVSPGCAVEGSEAKSFRSFEEVLCRAGPQRVR